MTPSESQAEGFPRLIPKIVGLPEDFRVKNLTHSLAGPIVGSGSLDCKAFVILSGFGAVLSLAACTPVPRLACPSSVSNQSRDVVQW